MSYNIIASPIDRNEGFNLPLNEIVQLDVQGPLPEAYLQALYKTPSDGPITVESFGGQVFTGFTKGDRFYLTELDLTGDGSGHQWAQLYERIFHQGQGQLQLRLVWEGGDIDQYTYANGTRDFKRL